VASPSSDNITYQGINMTNIDRALLKALRADIDAALMAVGQKHGVAIEATTASFTTNSATFKLLVVSADTSATQSTTPSGPTPSARDLKAAVDMALAGEVYGCEADWAGKTFKRNTMVYTIVGLLPGRTKNCVLVRTSNGANYVMTPASVREYLV
jgi:hypothetical protein